MATVFFPYIFIHIAPFMLPLKHLTMPCHSGRGCAGGAPPGVLGVHCWFARNRSGAPEMARGTRRRNHWGSCWLFFDTDILTPHNWILGDGGGIMVGFFHMGHGTWGVFNIYIYIFVCLFDFGVLKWDWQSYLNGVDVNDDNVEKNLIYDIYSEEFNMTVPPPAVDYHLHDWGCLPCISALRDYSERRLPHEQAGLSCPVLVKDVNSEAQTHHIFWHIVSGYSRYVWFSWRIFVSRGSTHLSKMYLNLFRRWKSGGSGSWSLQKSTERIWPSRKRVFTSLNFWTDSQGNDLSFQALDHWGFPPLSFMQRKRTWPSGEYSLVAKFAKVLSKRHKAFLMQLFRTWVHSKPMMWRMWDVWNFHDASW